MLKKYGNSEEVLEILNENKINSTTIEIPQELLKEVFFKAMNKEITLEKAQEILNIKDRETLRVKFLQYAETSDNEEIRNLYKKYVENHNKDYSDINFRMLAIRMVRERKSQSEIAKELGIPPRVISREFEKFSKDKDLSFYNFIKSYNEARMVKANFSDYVLNLQILFLDKYEQEHQDELHENTSKTKKQERIEKEEFYLKEEERLKSEGFTQKEISEKLGISVSTLRRLKLSNRKREVLKGEGEEITLDKD